MRQSNYGRNVIPAKQAPDWRQHSRDLAQFGVAILLGILTVTMVPDSWNPLHEIMGALSRPPQAAGVAEDTSTSEPISPSQSATHNNPSFTLCGTGPRTNCVVDGDTFWLDGTKIRIADIDAPEIHPSRCAREEELGQAAKNRLLELLNAGPVELENIDRNTDVYGRELRIVRRGGASLGDELVGAGLARHWDGHRHPWC